MDLSNLDDSNPVGHSATYPIGAERCRLVFKGDDRILQYVTYGAHDGIK